LIIVNSLLLGSIVLMVARVYQPWVDRPTSRILSTFKIPFRSRVRMQRFNAYAFVALLLLGAVGGWLSPAFEVLVTGLALVALNLPVRYTLTDEGIGLGRTSPRHWTEFSAVNLRPGRARLKGADDWRDMEVWLPRSGQDADVVAIARQRIAAARSGSLRPAPGPTDHSRLAHARPRATRA
jgi:hypothetical protein